MDETEGIKGKCGPFLVSVPRKWLNSRFIAFFNKTPRDIVCPHFWELKWANGCPFQCTYCYLQGTFYGRKNPRMKDLAEYCRELNSFLSWADENGLRLVLNSGELCDSLAVPSWTEKFIDATLQVLERHEGHRVLLVSKGGVRHVQPLLRIPVEFRRMFIASFSLNAFSVARDFEIGAPLPLDRIKAAKMLEDAGFEVRIRIDPIIPVSNWKSEYFGLLEVLFEKYGLKPTRVTLGSLRGLWKTVKFSKNRNWYKFLKNGERTGWGLKLVFDLREEIYRVIIKMLRNMGFKGDLALCKETHEMWVKMRELLYDPGVYPLWENVKCNCIA